MKKIYTLLTVCLLAAFTQQIMAQSAGTPIQLGMSTYHSLDRMDILAGKETLIKHTSLKPFNRQQIVKDLYRIRGNKEWEDSLDLRYIYTDNHSFFENTNSGGMAPFIGSGSKKPFLKYFWRTPANFLEVNTKHFNAYLNPMLNLKAGYEVTDGVGGIIGNNQRGIELGGDIDGKVYFYANVLESQTKFNSYVDRRVKTDSVVPGAGYYKNYDSKIFSGQDNGFDYMVAQGHIGFNATKHIRMELGHGRNFIGDGMRSLLLSDFSNNYFYLKLNTRVWRFNYQNIFAELTTRYGGTGQSDRLLGKKYMAAHHLSFDVAKNFNIGLYEAVIFNRQNGFELQYLNPIILYRTVEHQLGSPDNVLLGANFKWNLLNSVQLYGQFVLDEFNFGNFFKNNGWWANKYGIQAGVKYINAFGVKHLDAQLEFNTVTPYTYTHNDSLGNYTHYNQPLAHPLGANFREIGMSLSYRPRYDLSLNLTLFHMQYGQDSLGSNWGSNIMLPSTTKEQEFGNGVAQGVRTNTTNMEFRASWMFKHNVFLDFQYLMRRQAAELTGFSMMSHYVGIGFRMNMADRRFVF